MQEFRKKLLIWGVGGLGGIQIVNIMKRIAGKLRKIILLHFGLVTFRIHSWKTRKPTIFMVLGPGGRDQGTPNIIYLWAHRDTPNNSRRIPNHL